MENISPIHFTPTKWKNLKWFSIIPNGKKISNWETAKHVYLHKVEKMEKFSLFLYVFDFISRKWKTFHRCHFFHEMLKKLSNFLYFFIHISFHFHFSKWITCSLFPRSGKYFINALYFLEVDKCLMNCITAKLWKMIKTEAGIFGYKYEVEKIKRLHLFLYIFAFICTRWKIFTSTCSPKVFNDLYYIHKV